MGGRGGRSSRGPRAWPELEDGVEEQFLVTVAKKVRDNGKAFEEVLRQREKENPRFAFLKDEQVRVSLTFCESWSSRPLMVESFLGLSFLQRPSYHYFRMLVDPDYEPPIIATFDDEVSPQHVSEVEPTSTPANHSNAGRETPRSIPRTAKSLQKTNGSARAKLGNSPCGASNVCCAA